MSSNTMTVYRHNGPLSLADWQALYALVDKELVNLAKEFEQAQQAEDWLHMCDCEGAAKQLKAIQTKMQITSHRINFPTSAEVSGD